jgi:hypothetical protein
MRPARTAAVFLLLLAAPLFLSCGGEGQQQARSPESVFNEATESMVKGDDPGAIVLYYKLLNDYPSFKKYRADTLFRLGTLLYKTERYDEAEKTFVIFSEKFDGDDRLKTAYEKLINIYVQEFHDDARAQKIRDLYAAKFGGTPTLQAIDKTIKVLNSADSDGTNVLSLDASGVAVTKWEKTASVDKDVFPVCNYILKSAKSPDGKYDVEKKKSGGRSCLFTGPADSKLKKIPGSEEGYAPQWSWDSRFIAFTTMNYLTMERHIKIYDSLTGKTSDIFRARGVEPMLAISPDKESSKLVFSYNSRLWIINRNGNSLSLLNKTLSSASLDMAAWSKEGNAIIFSRKNAAGVFYLCQLGRREIETIN